MATSSLFWRHRGLRAPVIVLIVMSLTACGSVAPGPSSAPVATPSRSGAASAPPRASESNAPSPTEAVPVDPVSMLGPWTPSSVAFRADAISWIDAACRAESSAVDFETEIGALPLVVVDGRGDGVVTTIFASENRFAACRAMFDQTGGAAFETDPVKPVLAAVGNEHLTVVELATKRSLRTDRTFVVGRVDDTAATVRVRLSDGAELDASIANRWFAAWWPGATAATEISALDRQGRRLGSVQP